jgi:hypothetical protein
LKITRHRRLLIALFVIIVGVLAGLAWLVWPESPPKNLTLRLKFVRSEVVVGNTKLLFRVEGADKYEILIQGCRYVSSNYLPPSDGREPADTLFDPFYFYTAREFHVDQPKSSPFNDEGSKLQAIVCVVVHESKFSKLRRVAKDALAFRKPFGFPFFSLAKFLWQSNERHCISHQVITSDVVTNAPPS